MNNVTLQKKRQILLLWINNLYEEKAAHVIISFANLFILYLYIYSWLV